MLLNRGIWTPEKPNGTNGTIASLKEPTGLGKHKCVDIFSYGNGINDFGSVAGNTWGGSCDCSRLGCNEFYFPVVWNDQGHARFLADYGFAGAINNAEQIVGVTQSGATLWQKDGTTTPLPLAGAINTFGQVIGGNGLWTPRNPNGTNGTLTDLGVWALGINTSGQVVGRSTNNRHAVLWSPTSPNGTNGTMRDLNTLIPAGSGWELREAYDINDKGQIVGTGINPAGQNHGFLLTRSSAARLSLPARQPNGGFRFALLGEAGRSYTIQASTNLVNWMAVTNFVSATGTNEFTDATAPNFSRRFYHAVSP